MSQQTTCPWEAKRTDETREIENLLRQEFEQVDAYRFNSASIRVRVIDSRFKDQSTEAKDSMVEPWLKKLSENTQRDIMVLLTLFPGEPELSTRAAVLNLEFEDPRESNL